MPKTRQTKLSSKADSHAEEPSSESRYFSRAVGKAIQILESLSRSQDAMRLHDLSRQMQLTKSSTLRLLQTLETLDYIRRDANGLYHLSERTGVQLSPQSLHRLTAAASEPMRQLNMEFGETVSMAVLMSNHIEVVHVVESGQLIRMTNIVGRILPPHASSMGKMITACQDAETRKRLLDSYGLTRYTTNTIVDERSIEEEYAFIRAHGYSVDAEETTPDGICFGVKIAAAALNLEAAISLSMPRSRLPSDEAGQEQIIHALMQTAASISENLESSISDSDNDCHA